MPAQPTPDAAIKPDTSRRDAAIALLGVYLAAVVVRLALNRMVAYPTILPDELWHWEYAQSLSLRHGVSVDGRPVDFPSWLYPMFLAPLAKGMAFEGAFRAARILNVLLIHLSLLPAYRFGRLFLDRRRAVAAAALSALPATLGLCGTFMTENLYLPVFMLAAWMGARALLAPSLRNRAVAGLALGLAFHVKPEGLSLPIIFALAAAIFHGPALAEAGWGKAAWRNFARAILAHWATAAGWAAAMLPRLAGMIAFTDYPAEYGLGPPKPVGWGMPAAILLANFGVLLAATGFVPGYAFLRGCRRMLSAHTPRGFRAPCAFAAATAIILLPMMSGQTLALDPVPQLRERSLLVLYPMLCAIWAVFGFRLRGAAYGWRGVGIYFAAALLACAAILHFAIPARFTLSSWTPTLSGLFFLIDHPDSSRYFTAAILLVAAWTGLQSLCRRMNWRGEIAAAVSVMLLANAGWYLNHTHVLKPNLAAINRVAAGVAREIGDDDPSRLFILSDGMKQADAWIINFRNHAIEATTDSGKAAWPQTMIATDAGGILVIPPGEPPGIATWILTPASRPLLQQPSEMLEGFDLYKVEAANPPRPAPPGEREAVALAHRIQDVFRGLKIVEGSAEIPQWTTGGAATFAARVKNEGDSKVAPKSGRVALAYHWSNFEATGSYDSLVWDDGNYGRLPEIVQPGAEIRVEWTIATPPFADDRWLLIIEPVYIDGNERLFGGRDKQLHVKTAVSGGPAKTPSQGASAPSPPARSPTAPAPQGEPEAAKPHSDSPRVIKADPAMKVK